MIKGADTSIIKQKRSFTLEKLSLKQKFKSEKCEKTKRLARNGRLWHCKEEANSLELRKKLT